MNSISASLLDIDLSGITLILLVDSGGVNNTNKCAAQIQLSERSLGTVATVNRDKTDGM